MISSERVHFIGIAGTGMSALAYILSERGYKVSGSDLQENLSTIRLRSKGVKIYFGHRAEQIEDAQLIVVSSAIPEDNEELVAARNKNIPILQRGELLALLTKEKKSIIISGAHGKTTTTSMIAMVLEKNNLDPTVLVGGEVEDIGGNAKLGKGEYLVAEADESDGSMLKLFPYLLIVTNIDNDHLDYYGNVEKIKEAFLSMINKVPEDGYVILGKESSYLRELLPKIKRSYFTYGLERDNDFYPENIYLSFNGSEFDVNFKKMKLGRVKLNVPGIHNIYNALSAIAVSEILGLDTSESIKALERFKGVQRRLQLKGRIQDILIFDDYGHHPTEIRATLNALKLYNRRLVVAFQPHRYTRTYYLLEELADSLRNADVVIITEIYPAGEKPIFKVSGKNVYDILREKEPQKEIYFCENLTDVAKKAHEVLKDKDIFLTLGAGNIWKVGEALLTYNMKEDKNDFSH
ncbi:MAG: UDP-N-acetylmuramate--L-alanine ligase [Dictyoglomus sp.]|nr:UDP-N-acetylmuramate--L-alanine ligase [Dictyoglomus sp.]MCX7942357.1 UDP-N-acetylmuramate--L-alanine ligase [Dictyoglomaceae bacterium]MDW8188439.1 UDP-N-acetylmuramate--L-alanine ligase [Dictyoglomus sp.]